MNECNIYIYYEGTESEIDKFILELFDDTIKNDNYSIRNNTFEVYVDQNPDHNTILSKSFPDGFLYFKFIAYFDIVGDDHEKYKEQIESFLKYLWNNQIPAVATSDLEDRLINNGGYKNANLPWPPK